MPDLECFCYAVGHGQEGVCLALTIGPYCVLLDCGVADTEQLFSVVSPAKRSASMSSGGTMSTSAVLITKDGQQIDAVVCSHAHTDHSRGLGSLQLRCPDLPIYASEVTARLLSVQWLGRDRFPGCVPLAWRSPLEICPGLTLQLWPSGHLPGAACILLTYDDPERRYTVFYTGDCMLSPSRLVDGMPLDELRGMKPDVLIVDGSYGTGRYARRKDQENELADLILQAIAQQYSVILPTSRLGLGQEVLMLLRSHHHFTGQDIDIWVSPGIAAGCDAYLDLLPYFPPAVQNFAQHQPLFWDDRIRPRVHRLPMMAHEGMESESVQTATDPERTPTRRNNPAIFLTEPTLSLDRYCQNDRQRWMILYPRQPRQVDFDPILSQQIQESSFLQEKLQTGAVKLGSYALSDHCDGPALMQLIHSMRPQHLVLVHGQRHFLTDLAGQEELQTRYHLHLPTANTRLELPIGDRFIQPEPPVQRYEGELTTLQTTVLFTLDPKVQDDARWQQFADTGLIEAQWQGNDLIIRGIQPQSLLRTMQRESPFPLECCDRCLYYRNQRCWNQNSSLFGFQVTPEGSCPVFEPR